MPEQNELKALCQLMFETHRSLSELYVASYPELDLFVERARENNSITGSRLMGGGFGGCTINLIFKKEWQVTVAIITAAYKAQFNNDAQVSEAATGNGNYEVTGKLQLNCFGRKIIHQITSHLQPNCPSFFPMFPGAVLRLSIY